MSTKAESEIGSQVRLYLYQIPKKNHSEMLNLAILKFDLTQLDSLRLQRQGEETK
jgi:hypothetical protein